MKESFDYYAMGGRIRALREKRGMTQSRLAEAVGISASFVGHIERGEKKASLETITRIASSLGSSLDYIVSARKGHCNQLSCPLYIDMAALVAAYGEEQAHFPRLFRRP